MSVEFEPVRINALAGVAQGAPRYRVKFLPVATLNSELHTVTSREIALLCLSDRADAFLIENRFVGGDVWSDELGDYTDPVFETVVLRSAPSLFEKIGPGPGCAGRVEWSGGTSGWNPTAVETLSRDDEPIIVSVANPEVHTTKFEGTPREFLIELDLISPAGSWKLSRSRFSPHTLSLAAVVG